MKPRFYAMLALLFSMFASIAIYAQPEAVETILQNDPFDPDRGAIIEAQEEKPDEVEAAVVPQEDMPVLDGVILLGKTRMAIFSQVQTEKGKNENRTVRLNGEVSGYRVTAIEREHVVLTAKGQDTTLRLFSGQKQKRGGSKKVPSDSTRTPANREPRVQPNAVKPEPNSVSSSSPAGTPAVAPATKPDAEKDSNQPDQTRKNPPRRI